MSTSGSRGWTSILNTNSRRLAVVGDPIEHSRSPQLHYAAYGVLGLPWEYSRSRVEMNSLAEFVEELESDWRGLSVTMPLKSEAFRLAHHHDSYSSLTGVSNTLLFDGGDIRSFNTDVMGLVSPIEQLGISSRNVGSVVGSGATALSAVVALAHLGFSSVQIVARSEDRATDVIRLSGHLGLGASFVPVSDMRMADFSDVVVNTVPGSAGLELELPVTNGAVLFDVAYDVWPSASARYWENLGGVALSGLAMLAAQAFAQVRIFVTGDPDGSIDKENDVRKAMYDAVGLDESGLFLQSVG